MNDDARNRGGDQPGESTVVEQRQSEAASTEPDCPGDLPAIDFSTFVLSMTHSALIHLGDAPNPATGASEVDLGMARQTIDILGLLQEKCRGNLTGEEERVLNQSVYDLRMRFVEVARCK
jgi:hypothetical protein